jgi:hypothetical protein
VATIGDATVFESGRHLGFGSAWCRAGTRAAAGSAWVPSPRRATVISADCRCMERGR